MIDLTAIECPLLDISIRKENVERAIAYFDGVDARIYRGLVSRLGSEEFAQNAVILVGLIAKLTKLRSKKAAEEINRIQRFFPRYVGVSYKRLVSILDEI